MISRLVGFGTILLASFFLRLSFLNSQHAILFAPLAWHLAKAGLPLPLVCLLLLLLLAGAAAGTMLTVALPVLSFFFFLSFFHWSTPPQPPLPSLLLLVMAIWLANIYFSKACI